MLGVTPLLSVAAFGFTLGQCVFITVSDVVVCKIATRLNGAKPTVAHRGGFICATRNVSRCYVDGVMLLVNTVNHVTYVDVGLYGQGREHIAVVC